MERERKVPGNPLRQDGARQPGTRRDKQRTGGKAEDAMKIYNSFLIRCWWLRDAAEGERVLFDVVHIQSGAQLRTGTLAEANAWMLTTCRQAPADKAEKGGSNDVESN